MICLHWSTIVPYCTTAGCVGFMAAAVLAMARDANS